MRKEIQSFIRTHSSAIVHHTIFISNRSSEHIHQQSFIRSHSSAIVHQITFISNRSSYHIHQQLFIRTHSSAIVHQNTFISNRSSEHIHQQSFIRTHSSAIVHQITFISNRSSDQISNCSSDQDLLGATVCVEVLQHLMLRLRADFQYTFHGGQRDGQVVEALMQGREPSREVD